ncbi:hypothetical protein ACIOYV_10275 [Pseudomonas sp. NPDC087342]|uniref:hypothetical protein n=1 Tax=Pseudomonas sp. NPDC087342 TaxID=3364437 RepID=UPI0038213FE2
MPVVIEKPSQLVTAIADALRLAFPGVKVGSPQDFDSTINSTWVLIAIDHDAPGTRANNGRIAHVLSVSLQVVLPTPGPEVCDLVSELKNLVTDNRWKLPADQCDLPQDVDGLPAITLSGTREYNAWTVSFIQTLYLGPLLLEDPTGIPKFARTWEVSNIDDPDQYTALED